MNRLVLPPELVGLIVEHFLDYDTLASCALISWTWVAPCQRAIFQNVILRNSFWVVPLLRHLQRYPHLRNLIRGMAIERPSAYSESRNYYLSRLVALFPLIPRVTSLHITFDRSRSWDSHDRQFIEAFTAFLHSSESLTELAVYNLRDHETDLQQMFSYLEGTNVKRVSLYARRYDPADPDFFNSTLSVVHLPAINRLRLGVAYAFSLRSALTFWLCQHPTMFPNLKHLDVVIKFTPEDLDIWFRDILKPAALQLESFTLELMHTMFSCGVELPTSESLFEGLHVKHFHLRTVNRSELDDDEHLEEARLIDWFTSMFRHLANSRTTVPFVDLTFTFMEIDDDGAISAEWATFDEVLSRSAFRSVQRIHFEDDSNRHSLITDQAHPELARIIRRTLPHLANRRVLCFT